VGGSTQGVLMGDGLEAWAHGLPRRCHAEPRAGLHAISGGGAGATGGQFGMPRRARVVSLLQ